jgi:hypothetical protein
MQGDPAYREGRREAEILGPVILTAAAVGVFKVVVDTLAAAVVLAEAWAGVAVVVVDTGGAGRIFPKNHLRAI